MGRGSSKADSLKPATINSKVDNFVKRIRNTKTDMETLKVYQEAHAYEWKTWQSGKVSQKDHVDRTHKIETAFDEVISNRNGAQTQQQVYTRYVRRSMGR